MTINVGDRIPTINLKVVDSAGTKDASTDDLFADKTVVLFGVPGAFTPVCSAQHLPGFVERAADLESKGVDLIACISVNDPFVMDAWARDRGVADKVLMIADGNGDFTRAAGLELDASGAGLGLRSQRYALIAKNGVITHIAIDSPPTQFDVSTPDAILTAL